MKVSKPKVQLLPARRGEPRRVLAIPCYMRMIVINGRDRSQEANAGPSNSNSQKHRFAEGLSY